MFGKVFSSLQRLRPRSLTLLLCMQEADSQLMYRCLRALFERASVFGGSLFSLAANVMGDIIHQDPLCYRALDEAGLPEAFINSVKVGLSVI